MSDFKIFLKENTLISDTLIDTMFDIYDPEGVQTDLVVDLDKVVKLLGVRKDNLMKTLKDSYTSGVDYILVTSPERKVFLTPNCFKRLCMRSQSKKAEEVRTYFLGIERAIFQSIPAFYKGIRQDIRDLSRSAHKEGYLSVIKASKDKNVYKLGRNTAVEGVVVVYKFRTSNYDATKACVELMLKERKYRKYNHVYEASIDMIKAIVHHCDDTVEYIKTYSNTRPANKIDGDFYIVLSKEE